MLLVAGREKMPSSPISLIQWLKSDEYHETQVALATFADEVNIYHRDVLTKAEAARAVRTWFQESTGNTQYCFLGTHGITDQAGTAIGIGASGNADEFVAWQELWEWYAHCELEGGLWLGACKSSDAAAALSPFLASKPQLAIPHIYGFAESIYPSEIQQILLKLLEFTRIENPPWLDEELVQLRAAVPGTKIELYYPASTLAGSSEYVNVDEMPEKTGVTFRQLLGQKANRGLRGR
jgi:hypothetical protein